MARVKRTVALTESLKAEVKHLAWKNQTTTAELTREVIHAIASGSPRPATDPAELADVKFDVDPDEWEKAKDRAKVEGVSLSAMVREKFAEITAASSR